MVNKSSSLAHSVLDYSQRPLSVALNDGIWPPPKHQYSMVACARWETQYILEWITYHRSIGFDHLYLYCNDDDPTALYEKVMPFTVGENPFVTFVHYNYTGLQFQMYFHFLRNYSPETRWFIFIDIDEFMVLKNINNVNNFVNTFEKDVDAIYFNWCSFGHNGHLTRPEGNVLLNYTRREEGATPFTKILVRSQAVPYEEIFWRQPLPINHDLAILQPNMKAVNVLNDSMATYYKTFPESGWDYLNQQDRRQRIIQKAFIAHYNMKSHEDFELRVQRSTSGAFEGQKMWGNLSEEDKRIYHKNTNAVEDLYLHDYWKTLCNKGWKSTVFPPFSWPCISRYKVVTQSSTAHNWSANEDAAKLTSGQFWGRSQNHSQMENNPWWAIDFEKPFYVHEIRLFNRLDGVMDRVAHFRIDSSLDGKTWHNNFVKHDDEIYGGADGTPFIWKDESGFEARYVKITIPGENKFLQFDQIEFYGEPAPASHEQTTE